MLGLHRPGNKRGMLTPECIARMGPRRSHKREDWPVAKIGVGCYGSSMKRCGLADSDACQRDEPRHQWLSTAQVNLQSRPLQRRTRTTRHQVDSTTMVHEIIYFQLLSSPWLPKVSHSYFQDCVIQSMGGAVGSG